MNDYFTASDGVRLAYRRMGQAGGPVVLLIHGLFSSAHMNWIKFGHAQKLVDVGFDVIMPDLRAHGDSDASHLPDAYPKDVLARDQEELIAHLGVERFHLGGFSLGARTTARLIVRGERPITAILAGMGLEGLAGWAKRKDYFLRAIAAFDTARHGDPLWPAVRFMKSMNIDREAAALLLQTFADTAPADLAAITMPTLVLCGRDDRDNGDPHKLVEALPNATLAAIPGTHMSSVAEPAMGDELCAFLSAHRDAA